MAFDEKTVATLVRHRLGKKDESDSSRIIFMIPEALKAVSRKVAMDDNLRDLMLTERSTATIAIASGKVDLSTLYSTHRALKEFFREGHCYLGSATIPMQQLTPDEGAVASYLGATPGVTYFYVMGKFLYLPGNESGSVEFAVPSYPLMLSQLPTSKEIEKMVVDKLVEMMGEKGATDYAEDGAK